ncbi:hypothetical protein R1sor_021709 [Riccia sorocarpa]|uniref:Uncharacterized protein n=1 Tax=Riccia sorocarpa TaxID=122646 RepID=A0ABD3GHV1_9MARC
MDDAASEDSSEESPIDLERVRGASEGLFGPIKCRVVKRSRISVEIESSPIGVTTFDEVLGSIFPSSSLDSSEKRFPLPPPTEQTESVLPKKSNRARDNVALGVDYWDYWVNDVLLKTLCSLSADCGPSSVVKLMTDPGQALEVMQDATVVRVGLLPAFIKCL